MPAEQQHTIDILFIADSDSQIFGVLGYIDIFREAGFSCHICFDRSDRVEPSLRERVSHRARIVDIELASDKGLKTVVKYDAVFPSLTGSGIASFIQRIKALGRIVGSRPFIISANNGLVLNKFEEGLAWRVGADTICLGNKLELQQAKRFLGSKASDQPFIVTGVVRETPSQPAVPGDPQSNGQTRRAIFAEQVAIPATAGERRWLFGQLNQLAVANPDWELCIKPRTSPGGNTFHAQVYHPAHFPGFSAPNVSLSYDDLPELMKRCDLMITVSSTVFFDAVASNIPVAIVADFGFRNELGTHLFASSGLTFLLNQAPPLDKLAKRTPDQDWMLGIGLPDTTALASLCDRVRHWNRGSYQDRPGCYDADYLALHHSIKGLRFNHPQRSGPVRTLKSLRKALRKALNG